MAENPTESHSTRSNDQMIKWSNGDDDFFDSDDDFFEGDDDDNCSNHNDFP